MKPTINYRQTACRLLAGLFFFLLLAPIAAGEEASTTSSNWKDYLNGVDKLANDKGGDGTKGNPILIATAKELAYFAQQVNEGKDIDLASGGPIKPNGNGGNQGGFINYYFALSADINLEKHYWTPIGTNDNPFKGYFDGKGHCVSGLRVKVIENDIKGTYAGLFGNAAFSTLQNLGVRLAEEGVQATAENGFAYAGGIAGQAKIIYCCYVEGPGSVKAVSSKLGPTINSGSYAGGIVGYLLENLTHCYATVAVKAVSDSKSHAGGIAGWGSGNTPPDKYILSYTYATGAVEATGTSQNNYAGGICGHAQSLTIGNNLALNDFIKGNEKYSNRIVGSTGTTTTLTTNYASPDIVVNDKTVSGGGDGDANGNPDVNLDIFDKVFNGGAGWDTSDETHLPKLKIRTGDGPDYKDWPTGEDFTPQSPPDATQYLQADKIANTDGGNGSGWNKAILIANRAELAYLAKQVNAGNSLVVGNETIENKDNSGFKGYYFALSADIDLEKHYWKPIGTEDNPFNGNFDGQGHCVSKLKVDGSVEYGGLFGYAAEGTLRNIGVHLAKEGILATSYAGGIAGQAANISNCYVVGVGDESGKGTVKAEGASSTYAGGIVGRLTNTLKNCYATVDVIATGANEKNIAGGIAGIIGDIAAQLVSKDYNLSYTYATGAVVASGSSDNNYAGGICGDDGSGICGDDGKRTLLNNLALNTSIKGSDGKSHRIVGNTDSNFSSNFSSTKIKLNDNDNYNNIPFDWRNGADTWIETFMYDLIPDPEWSAAWEWVKIDPQYLPKLKIVKDDKAYYSINNVLTKQPDIEIDAVLDTSADFPFEWPYGDTYLAYDGKKWLRNIKGCKEPTIPFNGTVNGSSNIKPLIIKASGHKNVSGEVPKLIFYDVKIRSEEENKTCLTVEKGVKVILEMKKCLMQNNAQNMPVIANAGNLTIKADDKSDFTVISANDYAIKNTGTLTLEGNGIILTAQRSAIDNDASVIYKNPMVEWLFASGLSKKSIRWFDEERLNMVYSFQSIATSTVPPNGGPFILEIGPRSLDLVSRIPQQGRDINNNYTGNFTANGNQLTVYTDVKDYPRLYLKQPAGGTLTVTDADGLPLSDGDYVAPGTQLTLSCSSEANYDFVSYQSGPAADNMSALSGNKVTIGDADIWLSASLRYYDYTPPTPIYYSVYLPQVEGATTDPGPGEYEVESWSTFRFYLTIDSAYSDSQPVVTTDRGETLVPRSSDGAYLVKYVRTDVEVFIDGLIQNPPPVANEAISTDALAPQIWAEGSMLCIRMAEALPSAPVRIFTVDGRLYDSFDSTPGLNRRQLPTGVYIVRVGDTACKVVVRKT